MSRTAPIQWAARRSQRRGQPAAEHEPENGHTGLEQAEQDPDPQPGAGAGSGHTDADGGREVGQAKGEGDQQQSEHTAEQTEITRTR